MSKQEKTSHRPVATAFSTGQRKRIDLEDPAVMDEIGYPQLDQKHTITRYTEEEVEVTGPTKSPPPVLMPRPIPAVAPTRNLFHKSASPSYMSKSFNFISYRETETTNEEKPMAITSPVPVGILKKAGDENLQLKKDGHSSNDGRQNLTTFSSEQPSKTEKRPNSSWKISTNPATSSPKAISTKTEDIRHQQTSDKSSDGADDIGKTLSHRKLLQENNQLKYDLQLLIGELEEMEHDRFRLHRQNYYMAIQLRQLEQKLHEFARYSAMDQSSLKQFANAPNPVGEFGKQNKDASCKTERPDRQHEFSTPVQSANAPNENKIPVRPVASTSEPVSLPTRMRYSLQDVNVADIHGKGENDQMAPVRNEEHPDSSPFPRRLRRRIPMSRKYYDIDACYADDEFFPTLPARSRNFADVALHSYWHGHSEEDDWYYRQPYGYELDLVDRWEEHPFMFRDRQRPLTRQKSWTPDFNRARRSGSLTRRRSVSSTPTPATLGPSVPPPPFTSHDAIWPDYGSDTPDPMIYPILPRYCYPSDRGTNHKTYPAQKHGRSIRRRPSGREMHESTYNVYGSSM